VEPFGYAPERCGQGLCLECVAWKKPVLLSPYSSS
jgi:hypothetical protein